MLFNLLYGGGLAVIVLGALMGIVATMMPTSDEVPGEDIGDWFMNLSRNVFFTGLGMFFAGIGYGFIFMP